MPNVTNSPNMNLPVPIVGQESGPQYGIDIDSCLAIIDQHNHSPGSGVPVTPSGLSMTADLPMLGNNVTNVRSLRLAAQVSPLTLPADIGCLYESGIDLYYNDGSGTAIRITQAGGVAGTPGSISNLVAPASASYVGANSTFVWQSAVNTPANMDFGSAILRNLTVNSFGLTLAPPNAMGSNTTITLPTLPAAQAVMTMDTSGNISSSPNAFNSLIPPGGMIPYAGASAPTGWLICDGSAVSRTTYSTLFGVLGTTYGPGDGATTFNLPGSSGRVVVGAGSGGGLTPRANGDTGGEETHVLTIPEMPSHHHSANQVTAGPFPAGGGSGGGTVLNTSDTGGSGAHNNMQPFFVATYIIKT